MDVGDEIAYLGSYTGGVPKIYWGWEDSSRIFHPGSGREFHTTDPQVPALRIPNGSL